MFDNEVSMFRCISIGVAVENKKQRTAEGKINYELIVSDHERKAFMDGEAVDRVDTLEYETTDNTGKVTAGTTFTSNNFPATWLPDSNRVTPPDIRRGEMVSIWQMGSSDKYYWRSLAKDESLRCLETIVIGISANPDDDADGRDPSNMYFIEMSSHAKTITLSTSQRNGEFCTYDFQFDMGNGRVALADNKGNSFLFDSKNIHMKLLNQLGTFFEMNKQDISGYAPKNISFTAVQNFSVKAKNVDIVAEQNGLVKAKVLTLDGGGSVLTLQASGTTLKTPNFKGMS